MDNSSQSHQNSYPAETSTQLAITRTRLAADRTLMSWIRTSLALISFGFTIIKFFEYLKYIASSNIKIPTTGITHLGVSLIILGTISIVPAILEYKKEIITLKKIDGVTQKSYIVFVGYCVGLIGLYTLGNVLKLIFSS